MYNDSTFDGLFTGSLSDGEWVYPTAAQNLVVKFSDFYLSAKDGDFSTDGATITSEIGESDDITVGNAPAQVFTATMLNPDDTMDALTWGNGQVYIGAETASASADTYQSYPVHLLVGTTHYSIDANGVPRRGTSSLGTLGGTPVAVISNSGGTDVLFITTTAIGRRQGSTYSLVSSPSPEQAFMAAKCRAMAHSTGILLDANGLPSVYNSVEAGTKQTFSYVPMGVFDFSGVDAYGITFGVEAFDLMTKFDADATEWWNALDFSGDRTLSALASTVVTELGFSAPTISADAVNTGVAWTVNPITSYSVTYRDIVKWLAEAMACNVRMTRTGGVEFYTFNSASVATITPNTIVGNSRIKGKATIPAVTRVVCYNVLGAAYTSGSAGSDYYVVANPFIDPSASMIPLNALSNKLAAIPAYFPTTLVDAYADPRLDAGDFISIQTTDGQSAYIVPLMHQVLTWNGLCTATITATGNQVRTIPEGMNNTDLSSMVDSNPSAVVNKILTHGLTVYDSNDNVLFNANGDAREVEIGGFSVTDSGLYYDNGTNSFSIDNNAYLSLYKSEDDTGKYNLIMPDRIRMWDSDSSTNNDVWIYNYLIQLRRVSTGNEVDVEATGITLDDGTNTSVLTAGIGKRVHAETSVSLTTGTSLQNLASFSLTKGTWVVSVSVRFASNATGRRAINMSTSSGGSALNLRWGNGSAAVNGAYTYLHMSSSVVVNNANVNYFINGYQNSGSTLTTEVGWDAVRVY